MAGLLASLSLPALAAPKVTATIAPVYSLVAAIMQNVGEPSLLFPTNTSPHDSQMRPSQARQVQNADVVFWVGPEIEVAVAKALQTIGDKAHSVPLMRAEGIVRLPVREDGNWERHNHDHGDEHDKHDHDKHDHDEHAHEKHDHDDHDKKSESHDAHEHWDNHIWLAPENAIAMAKAISHELAEIDPENAKSYTANSEKLIAAIQSQTDEIKAQLSEVKGKPFMVFHDAFQYYEQHFGLNAVGSIRLHPEVAPGAARIKQIREKLEAAEVVCLMSEPQFSASILPPLVEGTKTRLGSLDPIGKTLDVGPDLYQNLLQLNADNLVKCLSGEK